MKKVNVEELKWQDSLYHFAPKSKLSSIEEKGLVAQIGDASKIKNEEKARVYMSQGYKGILAIKNSFIYALSNLKISEIPDAYKEYFDYEDFESDEIIPIEDAYCAMEKRMKDEVYFAIDAKEGEDYLQSECKSTLSAVHDINGIENHNIEPSKLSMITTQQGDSAYDVVKYIYDRLLEKNPDKQDIVKEMNSSLSGMFDYIKQRGEKGKETDDMEI